MVTVGLTRLCGISESVMLGWAGGGPNARMVSEGNLTGDG